MPKEGNQEEQRNFFHQTRPAFLFLKDIINLIPAKLTWGGATAKFNTRKIYLEGATAKFNTRETYLEGTTAKFNTRETQKFRGFLEARNLVPAKFSTFKVVLKPLSMSFERYGTKLQDYTSKMHILHNNAVTYSL